MKWFTASEKAFSIQTVKNSLKEVNPPKKCKRSSWDHKQKNAKLSASLIRKENSSESAVQYRTDDKNAYVGECMNTGG